MSDPVTADAASARLVVLVNGVQVAGIPIPSRAGWQVFKPITVNVTLPAGSVTLRFAQSAGQYNIGDLSLTPSAAPLATPTKKPCLVVYDDFSVSPYAANL